jgi:hypothetical protein
LDSRRSAGAGRWMAEWVPPAYWDGRTGSRLAMGTHGQFLSQKNKRDDATYTRERGGGGTAVGTVDEPVSGWVGEDNAD